MKHNVFAETEAQNSVPFDTNDGCEIKKVFLTVDKSVILRYKVTAPLGNQRQGTLQIELTSERGGWLGFGASLDGSISYAEVGIGRPHGIVSKYELPGAILMDGSKQTLVEQDIHQDESSQRTVLTYTKLLQEPNEIPIGAKDFQWMVWAVGDTNQLPSYESIDVWKPLYIDLSICTTTPPLLTCLEHPESEWVYKDGTLKTCKFLRRLQKLKRLRGHDFVKVMCTSPNFTAKTVCCETCGGIE